MKPGNFAVETISLILSSINPEMASGTIYIFMVNAERHLS